MTQPMVDRLFWRAGFGPSATDRQKWVGKPVTDAVDYMLVDSRPAVRRRRPRTQRREAARSLRRRHRPGAELGRPDDPHAQPAGRAHDVLLAPPLLELADGRVSPPQLLANQNNLFRGYADLASKPIGRLQEPGHGHLDEPLHAPLPDRRVERRRRAERELRARADGALHARAGERRGPAELQRGRRPPAGEGADGLADQRHRPEQRVEPTSRRAAGTTGRSSRSASTGTGGHPTSSTLVLSQPNHPTYLVRKLWGEFIPTSPDAPTLADSRRPTRRTACRSSRSCGRS